MRVTHRFVLMSTLFGATAVVAAGQATTATMVGSVVDSTGASIPNANVEITEQTTSLQHRAQTNAAGNYEFTFLPPGTYTLRVSDQGFQTAVTRDVPATVNTTVRTDVQLKPGSEAQTVEVTDQAAELQTDRADVTAQLQSNQIADLPVPNSRNFQQLEALVPGVTPAFKDHSSFFDAQNSYSFQVNGQSELASNLQLEGIDDNERTGLLQVYVPPLAAIQTVDITTSNYAPEFGRSAGAVTNVVLKSGTNDVHGSVYEYNSTSVGVARNYFQNTGSIPRFTNNYYGATIGAPIRKDRTFLFADFLRNDQYSAQFSLYTIPTLAFRNGDLSASTTPIYDPSTGNAAGQNRTQFANNQIPLSRIPQQVKNLLALFPAPNNGTGITNNYQLNQQYHIDTNSFDVKLDQKVRAADHLAFRYSFQNATQVQAPAFSVIAGGPGNSGATGTNHVYNTAVEYAHVFSPKLITNIRAGIDHYRNNTRQSDYGSAEATALGIPGVNVDASTSGIPTININTYSGTLLGFNPSYPWDRGESNIDGANDWTLALGDHSIKFGAEVRRVRDDLTQGQTFSLRGQYVFADGQTALNANGGSSKTSFGNDFASFLLDLPNSVGRDVNVNDATFRQTLYFGFIQDTFQATHKLTLTYGLRWEFYPPANPRRQGGFSQYDPSTNSLMVSGYGNIPGDLGLRVNYRDFQPRVGAAYRVNPRTVVRAGFGVSNTPLQDNQYAFNNPVRSNISSSPANSYSPTPLTLETGFGPAPTVVVPASGIISAPIGSAYSQINPQYKDPTITSYNAAVEQDFGGGWAFTIAYVGNVGRQVPASYNLNAATVAGRGSAGQPEFATFKRTAATNFLGKGTNSNYNSLQASVTHRFTRGLSSTSAFTYQKAMGFISTGGSLGTFSFYLNPLRDYAPLNWNRTDTFSQSFLYQLPAGKGKQFLQNGVAAAILGGFEVSGVINADTGTPLFITASGTGLNAPGNTQVPNLVKPFTKLRGVGTANQWFDPTSFAAPVGAVLGNLGKNVYSGPGFVSFDSTLARDFQIHDNFVLQMKANVFNVLNHPTFANPTVDSTSSSFGRVTGTANTGPRTFEFAATLKY